MEFGENLTLKQAADFSGVSEVTMRSWAKEIANIERYPGGGYKIPRADLMAFLGTKQRRNFGGTKSDRGDEAPSTFTSDNTPLYRELIEEIKGERETLKQELLSARERIKHLEVQNDNLTADILSLTREMRELLFGDGKPGLSRWMNQSQSGNHDTARYTDIIEVEPNQQETISVHKINNAKKKIEAKKRPSALQTKPKAAKKSKALKKSTLKKRR